MTDKSKRLLVLFITFDVGFGLGVIGGYVLNDYTSREDPNAIQQIRQELEQQQNLDDFFERQQRDRANQAPGEGTGTVTPPPTTE